MVHVPHHASLMATDALQLLQLDAHARLEGESAFQYVPLYVSRPRSEDDALQIVSDIDAALAGMTTKAGKSGLAVIVLLPLAEVPEPDVPGPQLELILTLRVIELPLVNMGSTGTGITAEQCALNILQSLHLWNRGTQVLTADRKAITPRSEDGKISYDVKLRQRQGMSMQAKCQRPVITNSAGMITLSTGTSGAALYYTTDGSTPAASNAAATLYSAPFATPDAGTELRVMATKANLASSDIAFFFPELATAETWSFEPGVAMLWEPGISFITD